VQKQQRLRETIQDFITKIKPIGIEYRRYVRLFTGQSSYATVSLCTNGLLDVTPRGKYVKMYVPSRNTYKYRANDVLHSTQRNQERSPLLRLPPEIRIRIFEYVFSRIAVAIMSHKYTTRSPIRICGAGQHFLALLQVSRQTYADTALLPFSTCQFQPHNKMTGFNTWVKARLPVQVAAIRFVCLPSWGATPIRVPQNYSQDLIAFRQLPGLKLITLYFMFPRDREIKQTILTRRYEEAQLTLVKEANPGVRVVCLRWRITGIYKWKFMDME